jgi:hypothetical protein
MAVEAVGDCNRRGVAGEPQPLPGTLDEGGVDVHGRDAVGAESVAEQSGVVAAPCADLQDTDARRHREGVEHQRHDGGHRR